MRCDEYEVITYRDEYAVSMCCDEYEVSTYRDEHEVRTYRDEHEVSTYLVHLLLELSPLKRELLHELEVSNALFVVCLLVRVRTGNRSAGEAHRL